MIAVLPSMIHPKQPFSDGLGGVPARFLKTARPWTEEQPYKDEFERCESLKVKMELNL